MNKTKRLVNVPIPMARGEIYKSDKILRQTWNDTEIDILLVLMSTYLNRDHKKSDDISIVNTGINIEFHTSMYFLCNSIYSYISSKAYKLILDALSKLSHTVVCIDTERRVFSGSLISFELKKEDNKLTISVNKNIIDMIYTFFCKVDFNVVLSLKGREKKLYIYLCSNIPVQTKRNQVVQIATTKQICHSLNLPETRYNIHRVKNDLASLLKKKILKFFSVSVSGSVFYMVKD